jgi:hypothetical protein
MVFLFFFLPYFTNMCLIKIDYDYALVQQPHQDHLNALQPDELKRHGHNGMDTSRLEICRALPPTVRFFFILFFPTRLIDSFPLDYLYA